MRGQRAQEVWGVEGRAESTDDGIDTVASAAGMGTAATLRRHFQRAVGVAPDAYRRTFRAARSA